jgi:hypothetical protein
VLPAVLSLRAAFEGRLAPGAEFELPLLDLGTGGVYPERIRVTAESTFVVPDSAVWNPIESRWVPAHLDTIEAFRLEHRARGIPTITWVDRDGAPVTEQIRGGYTLRRSAFEIVGTNYGQARRAVSSRWRDTIPGMRNLLSTGTTPQPKAKGFLVVGPGGDTIRIDPNPRDSDPPSSYLDSFWDLMPLGDSDLANEVTAAVRGAETGLDSIVRLTEYVASRFGNDRSLRSFGTSSNTLQARRGNPDGKSRLLVAMARSAGIPARVVRGVAVRPDGAFGHTWAELWTGRWIAADPVFGQVPASPSLIPIAIGERSRPIDLVPILASARFLPLGNRP